MPSFADTRAYVRDNHLVLKLSNVVVYWALVALHIFNTFIYEPEYPNKETYLTPGANALWVWPVIHTLLIGFTVFQWLPRAKPLIIDLISYRFCIVGLLSAAFLYFQVRRWYILSFLLTVGLSSIVSTIFFLIRTRAKPTNPPPTRRETFLVEAFIRVPFSLYHAWSIVLVLLSFFQAFGKNTAKEHAGAWTRVFVFLALFFLALTSVGYAYASQTGELAGTIIITYVLYSIFEHQRISFIRWSALAMAIVSSIAFFVTLRHTIHFLVERYGSDVAWSWTRSRSAPLDEATAAERAPLNPSAEGTSV